MSKRVWEVREYPQHEKIAKLKKKDENMARWFENFKWLKTNELEAVTNVLCYVGDEHYPNPAQLIKFIRYIVEQRKKYRFRGTTNTQEMVLGFYGVDKEELFKEKDTMLRDIRTGRT